MKHSCPVVSVPFLNADGQFLPFTIQVYGLPLSEFLCVPSPAVPLLRKAMSRRGIDPDSVATSPFLIREIYR